MKKLRCINRCFFAVLMMLVSGTALAVTEWESGPYKNNANLSAELSLKGAEKLIVSVTGETEARYDFLFIYNSQGNEVRKLDGKIDTRFEVKGDSINIKLTSDASETRPGVKVVITEGVNAYNGEIREVQVKEREIIILGDSLIAEEEPIVKLADEELYVCKNCYESQSIVASLPADVDSGAYLLKVYKGSGDKSPLAFDLAIGQGLKGDKGEKGNKGDKGDRGVKGDKGDPGIAGVKGEKGDKGDRGPKGDKGDKGVQGVKGNIGLTGPRGIQGPKGDQGIPGKNTGLGDITEVWGRFTDNDCPNNKVVESVAICPSGREVVGGGYRTLRIFRQAGCPNVPSIGTYVTESRKNVALFSPPPSNAGRGWIASAVNLQVVAFALCAKK